MNEDLANEIQTYRIKYSREPILVSLKYPDQPHNSTNNPWWSLILIMTNLYNKITFTMTIPQSNRRKKLIYLNNYRNICIFWSCIMQRN